MALSAPTNITEQSNTATSFRITFRSSLSAAGRLYLLLTPKVYKEFPVEINAVAVSSGTNRNNDVTLLWSNAIFDSVMRGITYNLSIALKTDDDTSTYVATGIELKRSFFATTMSTADAPGFSISAATLPETRVSDTVFSTDEIEYIGNWHSYPKITLTGQFNYCKLVNTGTGAQVGMDSEVESGHVRVLETDPLKEQYGLWGGSDVDNLTNRESELDDETNIRNFIIHASNMLPRPMAIESYFYNRDSMTNIAVEFAIRYYELGENY